MSDFTKIFNLIEQIECHPLQSISRNELDQLATKMKNQADRFLKTELSPSPKPHTTGNAAVNRGDK